MTHGVDGGRDPGRSAVSAQLGDGEHRRMVEVNGVDDIELPDVLGDPEMFRVGIEDRQDRCPQPGLRPIAALSSSVTSAPNCSAR
ncbi:hypothetical protein [Streptomyces sp. V4I2]|uniref:hypothetical protein n=1 Tax=Streptomyces sp. V4I2 TaxID=3042280 RepID=UPI002786DABC|nr:hypothetical protein [Streptomyces sp. V4I2]MDQ1045765.1 hypothetical protein [Streptomyces sp. V4I2]